MLTRSAARGFSTEALKVFNNVAKQQFTISIGGVEASLTYEQKGKYITFHTTDVPPQFQGQGVGKKLAKHAFDYAKNNNLDVTCKCHFLTKYYHDNIKDYRALKVKIE